MKRRDPRERGRSELSEALARYGRERPRLEKRGEEPWPGDLFVLAETADFPVEWLIVERGRQGHCLAVAADANPALGCADVALPTEAAAGPLSVRCAVDLQIPVDRLRRGERTGVLEADDLDRVRRRRADLAAGKLPDPRSGADGGPDSDYEDWLDEVLQPARAALSPAAPKEPVPGRRRVWLSAAAAAALVLFLAVCGIALLARRFQQGEQRAWQEVSRLQEESRRSEAAHRRDRRALADERRRLAEAQRREPVAPPTRPPAPDPEVGRPLGNLVYASLYPGESRGSVKEIEMPPGTTYLFLVLSVAGQPLYAEYRVEVMNERGAAIWSLDGLHPLPTQEVTVALPRAQIPDGSYRLHLFGLRGRERHDLGRFEVRIAPRHAGDR
jgi:hypothetical protein